ASSSYYALFEHNRHADYTQVEHNLYRTGRGKIPGGVWPCIAVMCALRKLRLGEGERGPTTAAASPNLRHAAQGRRTVDLNAHSATVCAAVAGTLLMDASSQPLSPSRPLSPSGIGWRTPVVILLAGSLIAMMNFGTRSTLGLFLTPQSQANEWGRDVFGLAIAIQNLLWGTVQPFAGMLADRFGIVRVMWVGGICYAAGLALMAYSTTPLMLDVSAGVLIGFGLAGTSFSLVLAAFGEL